MPCILRPERFETYLNTPAEQADDLLEILVSHPSKEMVGSINDEKEVGLS